MGGDNAYHTCLESNIQNIVNDEKNLVMFALVLIIILGLISYNLYFSSNMGPNGNEYGCFDTIRNIFDALPIIGEVVQLVEKGHPLAPRAAPTPVLSQRACRRMALRGCREPG